MRFSASRTALLLQCGYPFRSNVVVPEEPAGEAAKIGSMVHEKIERWLMHRQDSGDLERDEYLESFKEWYLSWSADQHFRELIVEAPMACDTESGRLLSSMGHRDYREARPEEIVGTFDFAARTEMGTWHLRDWKIDVPGNIHGRKDATAQLQTLASMFLFTVFAPSVEVATVRVGVKSTVEENVFHWSMKEAQSHVESIFDRLGSADLNVGIECVHCPIRKQCPKFLTMDEETDRLLDAAEYDRYTLPRAYIKLRVWEEKMRSLRESVKSSLGKLGGECSLSDKRKLVLETQKRETLSKSSIVEALGVEGKILVENLRSKGALVESESTVMVERNRK